MAEIQLFPREHFRTSGCATGSWAAPIQWIIRDAVKLHI